MESDAECHSLATVWRENTLDKYARLLVKSYSSAPKFASIKDPELQGELKGRRGISMRGSESARCCAVNNKLGRRWPEVVRWDFHDGL